MEIINVTFILINVIIIFLILCGLGYLLYSLLIIIKVRKLFKKCKKYVNENTDDMKLPFEGGR